MSTHSKNKNLVKKKKAKKAKSTSIYSTLSLCVYISIIYLYHLYNAVLWPSSTIIHSFVAGTWGWTQGPLHTTKALYYWAIFPVLFIFHRILPGWPQSFKPPASGGPQVCQTHHWEMTAASLCICWSSQWLLVFIMNHKQLTGKEHSSAVESLPGSQCPALTSPILDNTPPISLSHLHTI